jgi:signal transduction histidine kinase
MVATSQHLFLAILGHDLRNPLATTLMASRFIMEDAADGKYSTAATRIHKAGQRMNKLVNDLIDYTRTNLGSSLPIIIKPVNLEVLCREAVAEHETAHPEQRFELFVQGDSAGHWDDNRIAQVLSNLLSNAVQYGSISHPVVIRLNADDDKRVVLSVANTGKVIPAEKINTIFDPLVRLVTDGKSKAPVTNLGIGLYIVREIVHAHGGSISVTSTEKEGTVFAVALPRRSPGNITQHWTFPARSLL